MFEPLQDFQNEDERKVFSEIKRKISSLCTIGAVACLTIVVLLGLLPDDRLDNEIKKRQEGEDFEDY